MPPLGRRWYRILGSSKDATTFSVASVGEPSSTTTISKFM
jgi:hypothetical protein